jgi:mannan endo-1,4-beta-mannosidase
MNRGACYYTTENNLCPKGDGSVLPTSIRNANIKKWTDQITAAGVPFLYWQVLPNADPHVSLSIPSPRTSF